MPVFCCADSFCAFLLRQFLGCAVLALGIWALVSLQDYTALTTTHVLVVGISLIIVGLLLFFFGGLGCLGVWKQDYRLLEVYFWMLLCLIIFEVSLATPFVIAPTLKPMHGRLQPRHLPSSSAHRSSSGSLTSGTTASPHPPTPKCCRPLTLSRQPYAMINIIIIDMYIMRL